MAANPWPAANPASPSAVIAAKHWPHVPPGLATAASLRVGASALGQVAAGLLVPVIGTHKVLLAVALTMVAAAGLGRLAALDRQPAAAVSRG
ncbi:hypothetical protein EV652_102419 [Kribbella steppae]|uniref:Uncharacterized protein n=1 Tax=Kribbella steppae TaxID=2512223 RepID=A0A4R2HSN5_9ACTN|nr:hypothetical protein EV652_102419 [Kribbella steppae]